MGAVSPGNPQSNNLFSYTQNTPTDFVDPSGLLRIQECTRWWWIDSNGEIHYTDWQCSTIYDDGGSGGGGGGGPRNRGKRAKFSLDKLKACLKGIGVQVNSFDFDRNVGGTFTGVLKGDFGGGPFSGFIVDSPFSTSTNTYSKDSRSLAKAYNNTLDEGQTRFTTQSGLTLGRYPKSNWIASDIAGDSKHFTDIGVLALFVHELGNSIGAQLFGKSAFNAFGLNGLNHGDTDFGTNLEACVFGGIVGVRSGRVGSNREF